MAPPQEGEQGLCIDMPFVCVPTQHKGAESPSYQVDRRWASSLDTALRKHIVAASWLATGIMTVTAGHLISSAYICIAELNTEGPFLAANRSHAEHKRSSLEQVLVQVSSHIR